jgi:riboflavin kinase
MIRGTVTEGLGEGKHFVNLSGYQRQFQTKLGYDPFPGTLNLSLETSASSWLEGVQPITVDQWKDGDKTFGAVDCYPVTLESKHKTLEAECHAIVPHRSNHDDTTLEIISPVNLREQLTLENGTTVHCNHN